MRGRLRAAGLRGALGLAGLLGPGVAGAEAAGARLDLSALDPAVAGHVVARDGAALCADGQRDGQTLAAAVVIYGRRPGRSGWGHASLRFLACADRALRDVEFEYYRLDATTADWFAQRYPDEDWHRDRSALRAQRGQMLVLRNERPVDGGWYRTELLKNREITEAWMPWSPALMGRLLAEQDARHEDQLARLRAGQPLDWIRYAAMGDNCTFHIREALAAAAGAPPGSLDGSVYPMTLLRRLEATPGVRLVVHPGAHALRRQARRGRVESGAPPPLYRPATRLPVRPRVRAALAARAAEGARSVIVDMLQDDLSEDGLAQPAH